MPTKAVPAGCILGLFALALIGTGGLLSYLEYLSIGSDLHDHTWKFFSGAVLCIIAGIYGLRVGLRSSLNSDMIDPHSSEKPKMRF